MDNDLRKWWSGRRALSRALKGSVHEIDRDEGLQSHSYDVHFTPFKVAQRLSRVAFICLLRQLVITGACWAFEGKCCPIGDRAR